HRRFIQHFVAQDSQERRVRAEGRTLVVRGHFSPLRQIADSNSTNAVNFSSARTTNRFPSSRRASAIHIVRSLARWFGRRVLDFLAASLPVGVWSPRL